MSADRFETKHETIGVLRIGLLANHRQVTAADAFGVSDCACGDVFPCATRRSVNALMMQLRLYEASIANGLTLMIENERRGIVDPDLTGDTEHDAQDRADQ